MGWEGRRAFSWVCFFLYMKHIGKNISAINHFSTLTCGLAWIKGCGWLFQRTEKKKNACSQHLLRNDSEGQKTSVYPIIWCKVMWMVGNSGSIWDLYCLKKDMGLFSSTIWQRNHYSKILPDMEKSTELSFQTVLPGVYSKAPGWGKVPLTEACLWWTLNISTGWHWFWGEDKCKHLWIGHIITL